MAKSDFCFTYYDGDASRDMAHMTRLERGGYTDIIISQRKFGFLTLDQIKKILGKDFQEIWPAIELVMIKVSDDSAVPNTYHYIEWLENSRTKAVKHSTKQKDNVTKRYNGNHLVEPKSNLVIPLGDGDGDEVVVIKNGVAGIVRHESDDPPVPDDLIEQYQQWTDDVLEKKDHVFEQLMMKQKLDYNTEAINDHLQLLARYPKMHCESQQRFRLSLLKHMREFNKPKPTNGFAKEEKPAGPYIAPKPYQEPITKNVFKNPAAVDETIKLDISKLFKNENFKPNAGAVKLAHLRKKKVVELSESERARYKELATGERIRTLNEDFGNLDNKKLLRDHASGEITDHEIGAINIISQELAYMDFLKSEVEKLKETVASE